MILINTSNNRLYQTQLLHKKTFLKKTPVYLLLAPRWKGRMVCVDGFSRVNCSLLSSLSLNVCRDYSKLSLTGNEVDACVRDQLKCMRWDVYCLSPVLLQVFLFIFFRIRLWEFGYWFTFTFTRFFLTCDDYYSLNALLLCLYIMNYEWCSLGNCKALFSLGMCLYRHTHNNTVYFWVYKQASWYIHKYFYWLSVYENVFCIWNCIYVSTDKCICMNNEWIIYQHEYNTSQP